MGSWPFTRLHFGCGRCIAISGPYIQVLDSTTGLIRSATRSASIISCSAVDNKYTHLAISGDDKKLHVWELEGLHLKSTRILPKKATSILMSPDGQTILVADKFGDVFSYPLNPPEEVMSASSTSEKKKRNTQASHENPHGTLVLGHTSIITSLLLSHDGRYIITTDRDEHIRVSRYPQGYVIERHCLGHHLYVSAVCLPTFELSSLVSGGGDPYINIWDWKTGVIKCQIPIEDTVRPFLKVREKKPQWHKVPEGKTDGSRRRRRKQAKKGEAKPEEPPIDAEESSHLQNYELDEEATFDEPFVLALSKIEAYTSGSQKLLVFSATGGTALFYCIYPSQTYETPSVRHLDISKPILDFVWSNTGHILVSVDGAWALPGSKEDQSEVSLRSVAWEGGKLELVKDSPLVTSLNGVGLQKASAEELASLDVYSNLALLPKHADGPEEGDDDGGLDVESRPDTPEGNGGKRQMGRLKTKLALLKGQLEQSSSRSVSGDERESKKAKLDID